MNIKLRQSAEERLVTGTALVTRGWPTGIQALTLLHGLASAPATASDALKLLHELQVHQVGLDLQHEQADQDRQQLTEDLVNSAALFDLAPFAYLRLYPEGVVIAANRVAADWLALAAGDQEDWAGHRIEDLLALECREAVLDMLAALRKGEERQTCAVQARSGGGHLRAVATATVGGGQVLMAFLPAGPLAT